MAKSFLMLYSMFPGARDETPVFTIMLGKLRREAESYLGHKIKAALVATPNLNGERTDALQQALDNVGLYNLDKMVKNLPKAFRQTGGAEAAAGVGMCSSHLNNSACSEELRAMPDTNVVSILFTSNALCVEVSAQSSAYGYYPYPTIPTSMDFSLGYDERNNNPGDMYYWEAVRSRITHGTVAILPVRRQHRVLLFGDLDPVNDPRTRHVIDEVMRNLLGHTVPVLADDPVFAVAKGAAEVARRGTWPYMDPPLAGRYSELVLQG
jgi:hypothetical protein